MSLVDLLIVSKSQTIWKPVYFPLNCATFVKKMHLAVEQQSCVCGLHPWKICQIFFYTSELFKCISSWMSLLSERWKWPASIFDSFFLEFISSCWGTYVPLSFALKLRDGLILARRQTSVFCILCATTTHQDQPEVYTCLQLCWAAQDIGTGKIMNNSISGRWWTDRVFIPELYHALLCRTDQSNCAISRNNTNIQLDSLHSLKNAVPFMIRLSEITCPWLSCTFIIQCFILCWISIIKEMTELMFCHCNHPV